MVKILITIVQNKDGSVKETWDYVNGVEYKNRQLQRVVHSEGAVVQKEHGQYQHEYVLRDHLGNTRVTFTDGVNKGEPYWDWSNYRYIQPDNTGYDDGVVTEADIKHINHTYPFGMAMEGNWNNAGSANNNRYLYNGKQWNDDFGMGWYDYGARFYDPSIARWSTIDPLAEKYKGWSPYNYCIDNPVKFIDPDGREIKIAGTAEFQKKALDALQKLTNDKLSITKKGVVKIDKLGKGSKNYGTALVRDLANGKIVVTIKHGEINKANPKDPAKSENGKGSGTTVEWNESKVESGIDVTGKTTRPVEIGLGHELLHARHNKVGDSDRKPSMTRDPDPGSDQLHHNNEVTVRQEENILRREHGVPDRQIPK